MSIPIGFTGSSRIIIKGLLLVWFMMVSIAAVALTEGQIAEYRIKAAYLYKFCDYVEWPEEVFETPDSPLMIGVLGAGYLAEELEKIVADRDVNGRPVIVKALDRGDSIEEIHILFVGHSKNLNINPILLGARAHSILTVTETNQPAPVGSVINFVVIDDRVRFDVELDSAKQSNLKISSRLLAVARNVINEAS